MNVKLVLIANDCSDDVIDIFLFLYCFVISYGVMCEIYNAINLYFVLFLYAFKCDELFGWSILHENCKKIYLSALMVSFEVDSFSWKRIRCFCVLLDMIEGIQLEKSVKNKLFAVVFVQELWVTFTAISGLTFFTFDIWVHNFRVREEILTAFTANWPDKYFNVVIRTGMKLKVFRGWFLADLLKVLGSLFQNCPNWHVFWQRTQFRTF